MAKLCSRTFTSNGTWTAPAGVTEVMIIACGGGGGGGGGRNSTASQSAGHGGASVFPYLQEVSVVPNTSYSVVIGTGGSGGAARTVLAQTTTNGSDTSFGALALFRGAQTIDNKDWSTVNGMFCTAPIPTFSDTPAVAPYNRSSNPYVNEIVANANASGTYRGGSRGASGITAGGAGGNANSAGAGAAGTAAPANSGAGGGGGGAGSTAGGAGGAGGSGILTIMWIE